MLKRCLGELLEKKDLGLDVCRSAAEVILKNEHPVQTAAFLALLRAKGETADELAGLALGIRSQGREFIYKDRFVDLVGTGGDGAGTINISTASALLCAAIGVKVIKHGNRAISSQCGSADLLEALGANLFLSEETNRLCLAKTNFVFCFAPEYHPALKTVQKLRKDLGLPTVFNLLGPLLNPAGIDHIVLGVFDKLRVPVLAQSLRKLKTKRSIVFSGSGIDELSCIGPIDAQLITEERIESFRIDPQELGLRPCTLSDLKGGDAKQNAEIVRTALRGDNSLVSDTIALNAAAALYVVGFASSLREAVRIAKEVLKSGKAEKTIEQYCNLTRSGCF